MDTKRKVDLAEIAEALVENNETWEDGISLCVLVSRNYGEEIRMDEIDFLEGLVSEMRGDPEEDIDEQRDTARREEIKNRYR